MSLEDDIKQDKFQSEQHKAAINIMFTSSWLHGINASYLKKFDITPEQFNVLRILRGSHPKKLMLSEVASRMIDKSSNCTRLVEKLRQKALVQREICKDNRRQVDISITDKGLTLLKKLDAEASLMKGIMDKLSKTDAKELNRMLDKLREDN
ncbi:MarR family transcriptional regulator [Chryseotalea sanaruensis]|uniref:MarR family transcriptional regulator n=1 Tax=Chryseotalea sanaruensis TaxID=2482724 RepID=A0A401UCP9_9BACT|nr:MarR family transcriptional regulator [Chryseotalea sanaruensis]GCC52650.1 MarR family transcriptional regulator [Chryseotalea sanaruensis]